MAIAAIDPKNLKDCTRANPKVAYSSVEATLSEWNEIPAHQIDNWNQRLLKTDASYRQYPYWNEPYRKWRFSPCFLTYGPAKRPSAYVCLLTTGIAGLRIGLIHRGPVSLQTDTEVDRTVVQSLMQWAERRGYIFLRFTHPDQQVLNCIASAGFAEQVEAFPFYRDPQNALLVKQLDDDNEMLASFQTIARRNINAASRIGYEIRVTDSPEEFAKAWSMFEALADRKGFGLSQKPLSVWLELVRMARPHRLAYLYTAYLNGNPINAIFVVRGGKTAEYVLGALDIKALQGHASPSCLLHWQAMRDFHRLGCEYYDLGGPGDGVRCHVYQFKRKFRPVPSFSPLPVTLVINQTLYRLWTVLALRTFKPWRARLRRVKARVRLRIKATDNVAAQA